MIKKNSKTIRIGFPINNNRGGPKIFLNRLNTCIKRKNLAQTYPFIIPIYDVALFSSVARFCFNRPYVIRIDGIYFDKNETKGSNEKRNQPIFNSIDKAVSIIYQSMFNKALIENHYTLPSKQWCVIPNGVDTSYFSPHGNNYRKNIGIAEKEKVIVTSASWRAHKRLKYVIDVFFELQKNFNDSYHLLIIGNPDVKIPVHPRIHYSGFLAPCELPPWYRTGDIFLYLSWIDNCPNTVVEAIASGLPVICTNQGGTCELIEMTKGGLVVDADKEFNLEYVDLYNPPRPNIDNIVGAVIDVFENLEFFSRNIDTRPIDIINVAKQYVEFLKKSINFQNL